MERFASERFQGHLAQRVDDGFGFFQINPAPLTIRGVFKRPVESAMVKNGGLPADTNPTSSLS
jgi:hypothetical protein